MLGVQNAIELRNILAESLHRPALPHLHDEERVERARRRCDADGTTDLIREKVQTDAPPPVVPYRWFEDYFRTGNRRRGEAWLNRQTRQLQAAAAAVWLGRDEHLDDLHDVLWSLCETTTWVMPAHFSHDGVIDLRVATTAASLATIVDALGDKLDEKVSLRVTDEIRRRVFDPYLDLTERHWWVRGANNWNAVCNGGVGVAALLLEKDPTRLVAIFERILDGLAYFLDDFGDDGGCSEGPGYWKFGFGWYAQLAAALYDFTDGRINLMDEPKVASICRYPLAVAIGPGEELVFADAHSGAMPWRHAYRINRFHDIPELFGLVRRVPGAEASPRGVLAADFVDLCEYDGQPLPSFPELTDAHLPDLGVARLCDHGVILGIKAGHNAEQHNHNDVGSFMLLKDGTCFLSDPGAPKYNARTFSDRRYEIPHCASLGHSVPLIDGRQQPAGRQYAGTLAVEGPGDDGAKSAVVRFAAAYDLPGLTDLTRTVTLTGDGSGATIRDEYAFAEAPSALEEAFITELPAETDGDGQCVRIVASDGSAAELRPVDTPGRFAVSEIDVDPEDANEGQVLRRIVFTPTSLSTSMILTFAVRF